MSSGFHVKNKHVRDQALRATTDQLVGTQHDSHHHQWSAEQGRTAPCVTSPHARHCHDNDYHQQQQQQEQLVADSTPSSGLHEPADTADSGSRRERSYRHVRWQRPAAAVYGRVTADQEEEEETTGGGEAVRLSEGGRRRCGVYSDNRVPDASVGCDDDAHEPVHRLADTMGRLSVNNSEPAAAAAAAAGSNQSWSNGCHTVGNVSAAVTTDYDTHGCSDRSARTADRANHVCPPHSSVTDRRSWCSASAATHCRTANTAVSSASVNHNHRPSSVTHASYSPAGVDHSLSRPPPLPAVAAAAAGGAPIPAYRRPHVYPAPCSHYHDTPPPVAEAAGSSDILHELLSRNNYNPTEPVCCPENARFFVIKSYSEDDIHRSIKYEIWCSTERGNERLDKAFRQCQTLTDGAVYLLFSVNGSGHFCGAAEMVSPVDYGASASVWSQNKWRGQFAVRWLYVKDVPNVQLRHIRLHNNDDKPVTNSRDTQEVPPPQGRHVMHVLHTFQPRTTIFDDFMHYEQRQQQEEAERREAHNSRNVRFHECGGNFRGRGGMNRGGGRGYFQRH